MFEALDLVVDKGWALWPAARSSSLAFPACRFFYAVSAPFKSGRCQCWLKQMNMDYCSSLGISMILLEGLSDAAGARAGSHVQAPRCSAATNRVSMLRTAFCPSVSDRS